MKKARVAILGFTFKENCQDTRNTKVFDIVKELREYGIEPMIFDPVADAEEARKFYGIDVKREGQLCRMDALVVAVAHDVFKTYDMEMLNAFYQKGEKVLVDVKGLFDKEAFKAAGYHYWRL